MPIFFSSYMNISSPPNLRGNPVRSFRRTYTLLAPFYGILVPWISEQGRTLGLRWLDVQDGERILEIGTGTGLAFSVLLARNPSGWTDGIDATPAMLARAQRRAARHPHNRYNLQQGCASCLPYAEKTFDAVFASYLIDVIPPPHRRTILKEMHRVLKPKGRLVLNHLSPPERPIEKVWTRLTQAFPPLLGGAQPLESAPLLRECNFSLRRQTTCVQLGLRSAVVEANLGSSDAAHSGA